MVGIYVLLAQSKSEEVMDKKHLIIEAVLCVLLICSIGYSISINHHSTENSIEQKSKSDTKVTQKQVDLLNEKVSRLNKEKTTLENELQIEKNNNEDGKGENKAFEDTVREAFKALYNFDPDSMEERKEANRPYLSDDLFNQYFNDSSTYGDSNGVESELNHLRLYTANIQGTDMDGLVAIESQSRMDGTDWTKGRNIYQVTYDTKTKKITALRNLGSSYVGDIYE